MSDTRSQKDWFPGNTDLPQGRRIFNVGAIESKLIHGRSAGPGGAPNFDQNFGGNQNSFLRSTSQRESLETRNKGRTAHFEHAAAPSGTGRDSRGDQFSSVANVAMRVNNTATNIHESNTTGDAYGRKQNTSLNRSNVQHASAQSLIGSSGEYQANPDHSRNNLGINVSYALEESTAAQDRPAAHISGLTDFLRKEYYRRMGIYLNGGRKEEGLLLNFWKDHVSLAYKNVQEAQKQQLKKEAQLRKQQEMLELSRKDPALYRRLEAEREAKQRAKEEQMEREQNIASRQSSFCRYHKKPVDTCMTCMRTSQRNMHKRPQSGMPGSAQVAKRNNSAVPEVQNKTYNEYDRFGRELELDVCFTISKDLEDLAKQEKVAELNYMQSRQKAMEKADQIAQDQAVDRMLQLYFLLPERIKQVFPEKPAEKEEKKDSPSKQAAQPALPLKAQERPATAKVVSAANQPPSMSEVLSTLKNDMTVYPSEVVNKYNFFLQLFAIVRKAGQKVMSNDPAVVKEIWTMNRQQIKSTDERACLAWLNSFFEPAEFLKRLSLHREYVCKSKTKQQADPKLYYVEIPQQKRQINLIDYVPQDKKNGPQALEVIQKSIEEQRAAEQLREEKRQKALAAKQEKAKLAIEKARKDELLKAKPQSVLNRVAEEKKESRIEQLAKPKDKWRVGKKLVELQQQFPHDRVLQRMVKEEFRTNQTFRYPVEYDKYHADEEVKMKQIESDSKGLTKPNFEAGTHKLEVFKVRDKLEHDKVLQKTSVKRRQQLNFEKDLINEAQAYTKEASKRLMMDQGQRKTYRKSLAEIYQKMAESHSMVVQEQFKLETYGMKEESETFKKAYPEKFKRYFFHLIKTLNGKAPGKMSNRQVYKNSRRLPTTFMVAGTSKRCTIHEFGCPVEPCAYRTHNKKIVMTANLARKQAQKTIASRTRVFYREDYQKEMPQIFMTTDDQLNCRFEPQVGSLNPEFAKMRGMKADLMETAETEEAFREKYGTNFEKKHPEVFKQGVLKKAQQKFKMGEYKTAMDTLMKAFKIQCLRRHFDPDFAKKQKMLAEEAKRKEEAAKLEAEFDKKLAEQRKAKGLPAAKINSVEDHDLLAQLKEDPDEIQKKMPNEDFEKKKLLPILEEAYELLVKIEKIEQQAKKDIARLEQEKKSLTQMKNKQASMTTIEDQAANSKDLFKTIMCPLMQNCPNDTRQRWPQSSDKTVTQFGTKCPYAHHPMELQFPQTLTTKINAISKIQDSIRGQVDTKKPQAAFIPTGRIYDCKGGCFSTFKCNMCQYRQMAGTLITDLGQDSKIDPASIKKNKKCRKMMLNAESKETLNYLKEMEKIKTEMNEDELYCKKFGLLKKAAVLRFYGREKDAKYEIARAATIVAQQRKLDEEKQEAIQMRWKFKLGLDDGFELPERANLKKKHPKDITDEDLAEVEMGGGMTLATVRLYIDKVSPFNNEAYNKNVFLDRCIEELYLSCENNKIKKHGDIEKMKKHIEGLEEIAELAEQFGEEGVEDNLMDDEGDGIKFKPRKTKMCPEILAKRKCKNGRACKLAHNPIQLELIPVTKKIQNLKGVVTSQSRALNANQTVSAWIPSGKNLEVDKTAVEAGGEDEGDFKPKSIFQREDLFKDPLDEKE